MPFPKTLYQTPNPEWGISECYELWIEAVPNANDVHRCWIVRELHGYFDDATKTFHHKVDTLHPTSEEHFLTVQEAMKEADKQVLFRAGQGFRFMFVMDYMRTAPPWYDRFEVILPAGNVQPLMK